MNKDKIAMNHKIAVSFFIVSVLLASSIFVVNANPDLKVVAYVNSKESECRTCKGEKGWGDLLVYLYQLQNELNRRGMLNIEVRDIGSNPNATIDLENTYRMLGAPELLEYIPEFTKENVVVCIQERFLFEGYVPIGIITDFIDHHLEDYGSLIVAHVYKTNLYQIFTEDGVLKESKIETSIVEVVGNGVSMDYFIPLVVVSGLLDGINPCAFAVLIFFVATFFAVAKTNSSGKTRWRVLSVGSAYIVAVFLGYLLIGVALLKVITVTPFPHLIAVGGSALLILLGLVNVKDYFWYGRFVKLRMPRTGWVVISGTVSKWTNKLSVIPPFIVGFLVSLFEFPCTGGVYVAILGLLASKTSFLEGFIYLIVYDVMFISPLLIILFFASNAAMLKRISKWQKAGEKRFRLLTGLAMTILGTILTLYYIL